MALAPPRAVPGPRRLAMAVVAVASSAPRVTTLAAQGTTGPRRVGAPTRPVAKVRQAARAGTGQPLAPSPCGVASAAAFQVAGARVAASSALVILPRQRRPRRRVGPPVAPVVAAGFRRVAARRTAVETVAQEAARRASPRVNAVAVARPVLRRLGVHTEGAVVGGQAEAAPAIRRAGAAGLRLADGGPIAA